MLGKQKMNINIFEQGRVTGAGEEDGNSGGRSSTDIWTPQPRPLTTLPLEFRKLREEARARGGRRPGGLTLTPPPVKQNDDDTFDQLNPDYPFGYGGGFC